MKLEFAGIPLKNHMKVSNYFIKNGNTMILKIKQDKAELVEIPGLILSYEPDMISLDDSKNEARAKMTCGHVISRDTMTQFLRSLKDAKKYKILCPSKNA